MKRYCFSLLLLAASFAAWAESYELYVCGVQVTDVNYQNLSKVDGVKSGKITFSPTTKTLTLDGVTIDIGTKEAQCMTVGISGLTVNVVGDNSFTSDSYYGLKVAANTTIKGTGKLRLNGVHGISIESTAVLEIKDNVRVTAQGETYGIYGNPTAMTSLLIGGNATVMAYGSSTASIGALGSLRLDDDIIISRPELGYYSTLSTPSAVVDKNGNVVKDAWVTAEPSATGVYALTVAGRKVTDENRRDILGDGQYRYERGENTLYVGSSQKNPLANGALINNGIKGLTIHTAADVTLTSEKNQPVISTTADLSITSDGTLSLRSPQNFGVVASDGSTLTLRNVDIDASGVGGFFGDSGTKLMVDHSTLDVRTSAGAIVSFRGGISSSGCAIVDPEGCYLSDGSVYADGSIVKSLRIAPFDLEESDKYITVSWKDGAHKTYNGRNRQFNFRESDGGNGWQFGMYDGFFRSWKPIGNLADINIVRRGFNEFRDDCYIAKYGTNIAITGGIFYGGDEQDLWVYDVKASSGIDDYDYDGWVEWNTTDSTIATVESKGSKAHVKFLSPGNVDITAGDEQGNTLSVHYSVKAHEFPSGWEIYFDDTRTPNACQVNFDDGILYADFYIGNPDPVGQSAVDWVQWTSSDESVASVERLPEGLGSFKYLHARATLKNPGVTVITASNFDNSSTLSFQLQVLGHEYVDLGLPSGTLWATVNIGASSPEARGGEFAWGETSIKPIYDWASYVSKVDTTSVTEFGAEDDAASFNWGKAWQTPSRFQMEELINSEYTELEFGTYNDKKGLWVTSKVNGNKIFLPQAGVHNGQTRMDVGGYWSRSFRSGRFSYSLMFAEDIYSSGVPQLPEVSALYVFIGLPIRPVRTGAHEYVDLGLPSGTKWATCNVGASKPEEYGDYFAWGETEPKSKYNWSTYFDTDDNGSTFKKYNNNDGLTELLPEDDAATVNWGTAWQMPSFDQLKELYNSSYTTTVWTTQGGVKGRLITSNSNGNSIFLPAAGHRYETSLLSGSYGYYWSRSLYAAYYDVAFCLGFGSSDIDCYRSGRFFGQSVRPVLK